MTTCRLLKAISFDSPTSELCNGYFNKFLYWRAKFRIRHFVKLVKIMNKELGTLFWYPKECDNLFFILRSKNYLSFNKKPSDFEFSILIDLFCLFYALLQMCALSNQMEHFNPRQAGVEHNSSVYIQPDMPIWKFRK